MFDVKKTEKEICLAIFKREIGVKKIDIEEVAERISISTDMLKEIFKNNGEFFAAETFLFWSTVLALSESPNTILNRNHARKRSKTPSEKFYKGIWEYIADLPNEKNNPESDNIEIKS
jgi:hypothetical protein